MALELQLKVATETHEQWQSFPLWTLKALVEMQIT